MRRIRNRDHDSDSPADMRGDRSFHDQADRETRVSYDRQREALQSQIESPIAKIEF
jgi:hypothetical protein